MSTSPPEWDGHIADKPRARGVGWKIRRSPIEKPELMQEDFHWKTETTEVSKVKTSAITNIHTKALLTLSFLNDASFRSVV